MSDLENKFRVLDMAKEKDCFISNKRRVRAHKLSQGDVFIIYPSDFYVMPRFEVGDCIVEIDGLKIPDSLKLVVKKIKYKKLKWWEFWKNWSLWKHKRLIENYTVKVM